ncbi:MAG TPA: efflux transporter outer membrane subunit [Burkholderiales bacterium]|nr:efflux transporter outer membrane subunit [Burkholderiales bacterium]
MKRCLALAAAALLAACAAGPDYVRPKVEAPAQYKELQGWRAAAPSETAPKGEWWTMFQDPELDALIARIDISNQNIRLAEARLRQARAVADQARAGLFPALNANASATRSKSPSLPNAPSFANGAVNNFSASLNASWEPDFWGGVRRSVEEGEANTQASAADLETARLSARATLAQDYFALRVADATRKTLEETVAAYARTLELTRNRYAAGVAARVDVVQAEVQLKSAQAQRIDVGVQRAQLEHAIALQLGVAPAGFALAPAPLAARMPAIPVGLPSELLERRPDVAAAERRTAAANAGIGVAQAAFFPAVTLTAASGSRTTSLADLFSAPTHFWSLGAALAQPLFDAGLRSAQKAQAVAAYDAQVATYRQTVLTGFQEVEDNLAALRILEEEAALQEDVVRAARESVELTTNQYRAGVVSYLNVITAQATLLANERAAADILGRRLTASVALIKALGGGWTAREGLTAVKNPASAAGR